MKDLRSVHMEEMLTKVIASVASCQIKKNSAVFFDHITCLCTGQDAIQ